MRNKSGLASTLITNKIRKAKSPKKNKRES